MEEERQVENTREPTAEAEEVAEVACKETFFENDAAGGEGFRGDFEFNEDEEDE